MEHTDVPDKGKEKEQKPKDEPLVQSDRAEDQNKVEHSGFCV